MKKTLCFLMALAVSFTLMACTENRVTTTAPTTAPPLITTNPPSTVSVAPTTNVPSITNTAAVTAK